MNKLDLKSNTNSNRLNITREIFDKNKKIKGAIFSIIQGEYDVVGGSISNSDNIAKETLLTKLFTGENSVIASWKNSRLLELPKGFSQDDYDNCVANNGDYSTCPVATDLVKTYQVGELVEFYVDEVSYGLEQKQAGVAESSSSLKLYSKTQIGNVFDFEDLIVFPELNDFFYVLEPNGEKEQRDEIGNVIYVEYNFKKITKIKNVSDINQVIQLQASVGEGYAWPKAVEVEDEKGNKYYDIELDPERLRNTPVKYLQLDFEDPTAIASIWATGRPATQGSSQGESFEEPRILGASRFYQQDGNKIAGNVAPSDLFFMTLNAKLEIQSSYSTWLEKFRSKYNDAARKNWSGVIRDNPLETSEFSGSTTDENLINVNTNRPYWDQTQKSTGQDIKCLSQSPFVELNNGFTVSGSAELRYEDWMFHNIFAYSHILTLPMQYSESAPFSLAKIGSILASVIGGVATGGVATILGLAGGGFIGSMFGFQNTQLASADVKELRLFINAWNYATIWNGIFGTESPDQDADVLPIDFFSDTRAESLIGLGDSFTSMKMLLTDKYTNDDGETISSTKDLGKDFNGDGVADTYWNGNNKPLQDDDDKWFIDQIIIQAIGKTNYIATFYDANNEPIQSMKGITTSKRTGNLRNWTTIAKTSNWTTNVVVATEGGDPIIPQVPDTASTIEVVIEKDFSTQVDTFNGSIPDYKINSQEDIEEYVAIESIEYILDEVLVEPDEYNEFELDVNVKYDFNVLTDINDNGDISGAREYQIYTSRILNSPPTEFDNANSSAMVNGEVNDRAYFNEEKVFNNAGFKINISRANFGNWVSGESISLQQVKNWTDPYVDIDETNGLVSLYMDSYTTSDELAGGLNKYQAPMIYGTSTSLNPKVSFKLEEIEDGGFKKLKLSIGLNKTMLGTYSNQQTHTDVNVIGSNVSYRYATGNVSRISPKATVNSITLKQIN